MNDINKIKSPAKPSFGYPPMESNLTPPQPVESDSSWFVPTAAECMQHWDDYEMFDHIKAHSTLVAKVAVSVALLAKNANIPVEINTIQASALLHDLAKTYCIQNGGNHSQLGAAWTMQLTGNPVIAMGVLHHVFWPFEQDAKKYFLPLLVSYADKRVMHDNMTSLEKRFSDLAVRYGKTDKIKARIRLTYEKALVLEQRLSKLIGVDLNECSFNSGRLV